MFFKQKVLVRFNSGTDNSRSKYYKLRTVPRIGEVFSVNVVDSGKVTNVIWSEDQNEKLYPTVYVKK